ncbi:MAG TPA: hypothetical protein VKE93_14665 [Candidatus Angelobacter sp.]|nr:hypothetical protein [Candidatus Angelobacter sp.]
MILRNLSFLVLASGMALAQANPPSNSSVADELKAMRESIAAQQQQIAQQQQQITEQRQQIVQQQQQIQDLKMTVGDKKTGTPHVEDAALRSGVPNDAAAIASDQQPEKPKESPLSFRIGGTDWTPGGFMDFNNIFRTVNTGNVVGTNFGAIPYNNTAAGQLTEFRSTGQYSRWNLKVGGKYGETNLTGYIEGDFNGNDAANVFVTTNPHTMRLRLYYLNAKRGIWEFTGGQAWSLITPNRVGVGPMGADLATTQSTDANIHVGMPYARDGQFRVAVHPNDHFAWAFSVENPQQITNGEVASPTAFSTVLGTQIDGVATAGVPNAFPDLMSKMAWDTALGGHAFHLEGGGLMTSAKVTVQPTPVVTGETFSKHTKIGGGGLAGMNFELVKNLRLLAYGVYGEGVARYFNGLGPQFVIVPVSNGAAACTNAGGCDIELSMVHSASGFGGFEAQVGKRTQLAAYYGGQYYQRNAFPDLTSSAATKPFIGFGGTGSANSNNRAIQEGSFVWTQTLWRNPQFGALLLINDASYSTRAPWFVAKNATTGALVAPKNAHMFMDHIVLRYVLP